MREKRKKKIKQAVFETIGVLISFLVLIPFLMVLVNSMKSKRQANLLQLNLKGISLGQIVENYGTVIKEARLVSSFLNSAKRTTAVLTTYLFMGQKASDWQLLFADVVLVSMPIVILYLCMQKYIVAGLSDGAVKG